MSQHDLDLSWPFGTLNGLDPDAVRMTAYEIFFTSCRSSPGFGGRNAIQFYSSEHSGGENVPGSPATKGHAGMGMAVTSKIKRALGLKMLKQSHSSRRSNSCGANPMSPGGPNYVASNPSIGFSTVPGRSRRPLTSAEIMRQQMKVPEASDNRLRKTLMRTLVGQMGRRAETIILPLELLRHLKPSEFNDSNEYHIWQKRQLKILEAGLLLHPSNPLDKSDTFAMCLRDVIRSSELKPIDTGKNSETMRNVCNCVVTLAWRSADGCPADTCHWADGFPFNVNLYAVLLHSIFDLKDESSILDEVDELLELMKKTWTTLGINKPMHDLCLTWVLFQQYVVTGHVENDLLSASLTMLTEVANDSKKVDREPVYVQMLSSVLTSISMWCEKQLLDYHASFNKETIGVMDHLLPLVFHATRILEEDVPGYETGALEKGSESAGNKVDNYTRSSLEKAFAKIVENGHAISKSMPLQQVCDTLLLLAKETEELAFKEKETYSVVLRRWHPISAGVAALTLHSCYGAYLKQFLSCNSDISHEMLTVLQRADKLEKLLVNMVVEDSVECEDGGKTVVREMVPYEVDSIIAKFLKHSIAGRLKKIREVVHRAKENETWNPKSKTEPYAQSGAELVKQARDLLGSFFEIPIAICEDLVYDFADGVERTLRDYITFVASCGSKQNYIPTLPPLTRCSRGSKFAKLWKKATPCAVAGMSPYHLGLEEEGANNPRPSTSRGTQRLYIRLNTLHYITSQLHTLDKSLSLSAKNIVPSQRNKGSSRRHHSIPHFDHTRNSIMAATHHVSEVAAYRLIFLDSNSVLYGSLYVGHVVNARISPALRVLKQNLTLLSAIVTERAQPMAIKEIMKASFEAYLLVLIAGGGARCFTRADHEMVEDDLKHLKRVFSTYEEGMIEEDMVEKEAETVAGIVALMDKSTEDLIEEFTVVACEGSGIGVSSEQTLPMPPTTGRWSSTDPNTMLRVLCHRKDRVANSFLKRTFHLAKRA